MVSAGLASTTAGCDCGPLQATEQLLCPARPQCCITLTFYSVRQGHLLVAIDNVSTHFIQWSYSSKQVAALTKRKQQKQQQQREIATRGWPRQQASTDSHILRAGTNRLPASHPPAWSHHNLNLSKPSLHKVKHQLLAASSASGKVQGAV